MSRLHIAVLALLFSVPLLAAEDPLMVQGHAAMQANDTEKAVELFKQAVARSPNNAEAHFQLGQAYGAAAQNAGMFGMASLAGKCKDEFERAVALDPNHLDARFGLLEYYLQAPGFLGGSVEKAIQQAAEIRKRDVMQGHLATSRIYSYQKKPDLAHAEYAAMIKDQPSSPRAHFLYGSSLISEKKYDAALAEFEAALKIDAAYMPAFFQIGHLSVLTGKDFPRGEESLKRYLAYTPGKDEPGLHRAHYWLGGIYEKQGRKAEARAQFAASLKLNGNQKDVQEAMKRIGPA